MATLTLDLPEAPRAQAAYRLAADCPLLWRAPRCARTARLRHCLQAAAPIPAVPRTARSPRAGPEYRGGPGRPGAGGRGRPGANGGQRQVALAQAEAQRHVAAERAALDRTVRHLIALAHPDRWPDTPLAHELRSPWWRCVRHCSLAPRARHLTPLAAAGCGRCGRSAASLNGCAGLRNGGNPRQESTVWPGRSSSTRGTSAGNGTRGTSGRSSSPRKDASSARWSVSHGRWRWRR